MVKSSRTDGLFEISGAVHLHSSCSDGSKSIPEITETANEKGLDFLLFSDHNTLKPKKDGLEGIYKKVAVVIGCELNDPDDKNHYLAFQIEDEIPLGLRAEEYVKKVRDQGGFGIIAHPAEKRSYSEKYPPYPWTDWNVQGFDGIEIWNQLSEWMEGMSRLNFIYRLMHPLRSIHFPVKSILEKWDRLNIEKRIVGTGGIDVHAYKKRFLGFINLEIYPYKVQFKSIRTHLLLDESWQEILKKNDFSLAERAIFSAIKNARLFIVNYSVGDGTGFEFYAQKGSRIFPMGARINEHEVEFHVVCPLKGKIRFIHNSVVKEQKRGQDLQIKCNEPGVYRVEIYRKGRGWIYSNPIVLMK